MSDEINLIHEVEAQRQHVRVQLPATVEVGGEIYSTRDWSTGGVGVVYEDKPALEQGKIYKAKLHFDFSGFQLMLPVDLEVRFANQETKVAGCRFAQMNRQQVAVMQQMVNAYVTGEFISVGDVIHVAGRNNMVAKREVPAPKPLSPSERMVERTTNILRVALLAILSVVAVCYLAFSLYEQAFVVSASSAKVTAEGRFIEATSGGTVHFQPLYAGKRVKAGETLLNISSDSGNMVSIDSPCDCVIQSVGNPANGRVNIGQQLVNLVEENSPTTVQARVSYQDSIELYPGQAAHLVFPGKEEKVMGTILSVQAPQGASNESVVLIQQNEPIAVDYLGSPVEVRVDTLGWTNPSKD